MFPLGQLGVPSCQEQHNHAGRRRPAWLPRELLLSPGTYLTPSAESTEQGQPQGSGHPVYWGQGWDRAAVEGAEGLPGAGRGCRRPAVQGPDPEPQHSWAVGKWHQFSSPIYWGKGSGVGQRRVLKPRCPPGLTPHVCSAPSPELGTPAPPLGHCRVFPCLPSLSQARPSASIHTAASSTPQSPTCPSGVGAEPHTAALGQGHACSVSTEWCQPVHRDRANRLPAWLFYADLSLPPTAIFSSFSVNQAAGIVFPPLSP